MKINSKIIDIDLTNLKKQVVSSAFITTNSKYTNDSKNIETLDEEEFVLTPHPTPTPPQEKKERELIDMVPIKNDSLPSEKSNNSNDVAAKVKIIKGNGNILNIPLKVCNTYINSNFSKEDVMRYQRQLDEMLSSFHGTREKTVAAAIFLATRFPKLPYFWGGGHECSTKELTGINAEWGSSKKVTASGSSSTETEMTYSYDCSGFVSWCLINGGYPIEKCLSTWDFKNKGIVKSITEEGIIDQLKIGDLADHANGEEHVGIIVDIDKNKSEITIAHISYSGGGMNLTTISTKTGKVVQDEVGAHNENTTSRESKEYFENVIIFPYPD